MKLIRHFFLAATAVAGMITASAQTAEEIVNKHIQALGGKDKVSAVTSIRLDMALEVMGNSSTANSTTLVGKAYRSEAELNGQSIISVVTDKSGWTVNPFAGSSEPEVLPDAEHKNLVDMIYFSPLNDYAKNGGKLTLKGKEKLGKGEAYRVQHTAAGSSVDYFIDATTYLITQSVKSQTAMGQTVEVTNSFSDYRNVDGVMIPFASDIDFGGQFALNFKVSKAEINKPVDAAIFEMKK